MRILTRYTLKSISLCFLTALAIFSFLVMAVETFMHLDSFMTGSLGIREMARYALASLSTYFIMLISISVLFSITYFLSNLSANNELISLYTAGLSKIRILYPIIIASVILTAFFYLFNESAGLKWKSYKELVSQEYFGMSGTFDASNTVLYDGESGYLIYADRFSESYSRLYEPTLIRKDRDSVAERVEADYAEYADGRWTFHNARVTTICDTLESFTATEYVDPGFTLPAELFKSQNLQIETMELEYAMSYLARLKDVNRTAWQEGMTDLLRRLAEPAGILVLAIIAMSMNYSYKKNVLLFSIVQSLLIAVVYYVADMVFSIAARQGAFSVYSVLIAPSLMTVALSCLISFLGKRI